MQRYNIFLYCNTFLYFFSTIIHKFRFLYHISENEQNKDKIGTIPIRARVPLYSKIESRRQQAHNPKIYKLLYKIGLVLKWIKICTYPEEQARDSEKAHKKVQNRKNRRKGLFGGTKFSKVKKYWRGVPAWDIGILWVAKKFWVYIFCWKKIFLRIIFF